MSAMDEDGYVMTISRNGQVSVPAAARARWQTRKLLVVDLGDRVVMRPVPDDWDERIDQMRGKYRGRGPSTDEWRRQERAEDARREAARHRP